MPSHAARTYLMTGESDRERIEKAENLAAEAGYRRAVVDSQLSAHQRRLDAINGSIEKHARNAEALKNSITALSEKLDGVIATLATQAAIEKDRVAQITKANEKQISTRMFVIGVVAIIATILAAFIASGRL